MNAADFAAHQAMRERKLYAGPGVTSGELRTHDRKPFHRRHRVASRCTLAYDLAARAETLREFRRAGVRPSPTGLLLVNLEIKRLLSILPPLP